MTNGLVFTKHLAFLNARWGAFPSSPGYPSPKSYTPPLGFHLIPQFGSFPTLWTQVHFPHTQFRPPCLKYVKKRTPQPIGAWLGGVLPLPLPLPYPTPCHLSLRVDLLLPGHQPISVLALIDSGASGTFLDPSVLLQSHLTPIPHPIPVELIDGNSASPVTHFFPTRIRIHGTHTKDITLDVIQLAHF